MTDREKRFAKAYKNIKKITGLRFDEKDARQVEKALSRIYINGHNLWSGIKRWGYLPDVLSDHIVEVERALMEARDVTNTKFISIMDPDDPHAVPRMVPYTAPLNRDGQKLPNEGKVAEAFARKQEAARKYEEDFREHHKERVEQLYESLKSGKMPEAPYHKASNFFDPELLDENEVIQKKARIDYLSTRTSNAVNLCNLILLNRGYTVRDLSGESEEVQAARRMVGGELQEIMYGDLSVQECQTKFASLAEEAVHGLSMQSMKHVDYSDESTYRNAVHNQWIGTMSTNLYQLFENLPKEMKNDWSKNMEEELVQLKNFTDGITQIDYHRLGTDGGAAVLGDFLIAQVLVDRCGVNYAKYRTMPIEAAKNNTPIGFTFTGAVDPATGLLEETSEEYKQAYRQFKQTGSTKKFKELLNDYVETHKELDELKYFIEAEKNAATASRGKKVLPENNRVSAWFDGIDMSPVECGKHLMQVFDGGGKGVQQTGRIATMQTMFLAYGLMEAEEKGQPLSIMDFLNNEELQKETGRKAVAFFEAHPIRPGEDAHKAENVRIFSRMIATLNRSILDLTIRESTPENMQQEAALAKKLGGILVDSHQLRDVVPASMLDIFMQEQDGAEKYQETLNQINIAKSLLQAKRSLLTGLTAEKRSIKNLMESKDMVEACMGMNLLQTEGKELLGKKIGAFPTDTETAKKIDIMTETASGDVQTFARETVKTPEGRKHFIEYLTSFGAKDSIKMEEKIAETVVSVQEQSRMMDELRARLEILNAGEQKAAAPYDWSAEFTPEQWRERLDDLYRKIDDNDPALLRSSEEYRALKKGLRDARAAVNDKEAFNKEMDKVFSNAGQYLENKRGTTLGKHYGWQRHSAVMHVMATLANRKADMLEPEGLADILGKGVNPQEKLENGMARLGLYLQSIRQEEDPAKADEKRFLLERVLRERGKNSVTRVQLRKQLEKLDAKVEAVTDKSALYSNLRDEISKRVTSHIGLNTQTVAWCKLMGAFEQMARNSTVPQIHEQAENNKVKRVSMLGRIGATALEITTRITDVEKPEKITRQEARVVVAAAAMNQFLLKHGEKDKQALDMFLKDKHTDEDLLESFRGSNDIVLLAHARGNDKLRKMVCTGTARELMGVNGKRYALGKMKSDLEQKRLTQIPKLQPARNNSMGKGMP